MKIIDLRRKKPANAGSDDKRARYQELVRLRKACRACTGVANGSVIERGAYDCDEIGGQSLWQGNLNAELMVVGQDWGNVEWFLRVKGYPTSTSPTNRNVVELLRAAGFNIKLANQTPDRGLLFFTNAVLCMKEGATSAPVKTEWLRNCGTRFLRPTIELVDPKVIVCVGTKPYEAVMSAYGMIARPFTNAVESGRPDVLPGGVSVFPVYHCGAQGVNFNRKWPQQIEDWKRIGNFLSQRRSD